jgi:hypothetical protein
VVPTRADRGFEKEFVMEPKHDAHDDVRPAAQPAAPSRRGVLAAGAGLALAAAVTAGNEAAAKKKKKPKPAPPTYDNVQLNWRFCEKCRGLVYATKKGPIGACPKGGKHEPRIWSNYVVQLGTAGAASQSINWFRCRKCAVLFFDPGAGVCPTGGGHEAIGAGIRLWFGAGATEYTDDAWDRSTKCNALFNFAGGNATTCPRDGQQHSPESPNLSYKLVVLS